MTKQFCGRTASVLVSLIVEINDNTEYASAGDKLPRTSQAACRPVNGLHESLFAGV